MSAAVAELRARLALVLDAERVEGEAPLATGYPGLDTLLRGGLPRGRITEFVGLPGSGTTTLMRRVVETTARRQGAWCAVVDATRTLAPRDWAHLGAHEGVWIVRPRDAARAAWCADVLLRSGAFALVVLDGAPPLPRPVAVRLERLAREHDSALLVVRDAAAAARGALPSALRLRVSGEAAQGEWRGEAPVTVHLERGGAPARTRLPRTIAPPWRLLRHPEPPDRRGTQRRPRTRGR